MRHNRRRYAKVSAVNHKVISLFSIIALVVALGALANLSLRSSISRTNRAISKLEEEGKGLRNDWSRAQTRWSECVKPENLERALAAHGLHMELASGEKIVYINSRKPAGLRNSSGDTRMASNVRNKN